MLDLKKSFSKAVAAVTACAFGVMSLNCTASDPTPEKMSVKVTAPDGASQVEVGDWEKIVAPLTVDLAAYEADGVKTVDPAALLTAQRSVFTSPEGGQLVIVRTADGGLVVDNTVSKIVSPFEISVSADLSEMTIVTPDGPGSIVLDGVPAADRARMMGTFAATTLSLADGRYVHGPLRADYAGPAAPIIVGIVFGSWLLCVTGGVWICNSTCTDACKPNGVQSATMNCGINITPGSGGGGALGQCTCVCNPPPES